ncbi:MAG TPA: glycosyltransferase family 39 protein [Terriglobales bacterium]
MNVAIRNFLQRFSSGRRTALLLFVGLSGCYISLSPASIAGQGYTGEEIDSGLRMLAILTTCLKHHPVPPMVWSRHGPVPILFDLPFLKLGKFFVSPDYMLSFQPGLMTAALVALLYLWLRKLCSPAMSLLLSLSAAFGTMLWPYAYISLETKQTFFVLLAGYLGIDGMQLRGWRRVLLFAVVCGLAVSVKSTGIVLVPAIAYLLYVQVGDDWRSRLGQLLWIVGIIVFIWGVGAVGRNYYWSPRGGGAQNLRSWLSYSWLQSFSNVIGLFGSPTKGLFVYSPVLLVSFYSVPRALRVQRSIGIYTLLVGGGILALLAPLSTPVDETWGPRYLHTIVPLLLLCAGAAWPKLHWPRDLVVVFLTAVGVAISFLGAFYYYGVQDFAARAAGQNTIEWITADPDWNHIVFDARLLHVWLDKSSGPVLWVPKHTWVWRPPEGTTPDWRAIDLRPYCQPQSFLVRFWNSPKPGVVLVVFRTYLIALIVGAVCLIWTILRTIRESRSAPVGNLAVAVECTGATQ